MLDKAIQLPPSIPFQQAAAGMIVGTLHVCQSVKNSSILLGLTSLVLLKHVYPVQPGQWVLIHVRNGV